VAIVDAYSTGGLLAGELARRGVGCVHLRSAPTASEYFARSYQPDAFVTDLGHIPDTASAAERLRSLGVSRVVAGTESGVVLADTLAGLLGLPGNTVELATARRDKEAMARAAAAAGVAVPLGDTFARAEDAGRWFGTAGLAEAVVKPLASGGTDHVAFARTPDEVRGAAEAVLGARNLFGEPNLRVLVQQRVLGTEFYANTVSHEGTHRLVELWRYAKTTGPSGAPVYDFEEPVLAGSTVWRQLRGFVFGVLDALGVRSSAAHTELILGDQGPVLIETAARLGGATSPEVVEKFSGASQTGVFADTLVHSEGLAGFRDDEVVWQGHVRNTAFRNHHTGTVRSLDWLGAVSTLPTAVHAAAGVAVGDRLSPTVDLISSPGYVYLASGDPAAVAADHATLRRWEQEGLYCS
jgi:biotin carboxylase